MSQICNPCAENPVCLDFPDRYNLQEDVYYFVLNCLPGFYCGGNNVIFLVCCDGTIMQQVLPQGITAAQREAYISELIASCFRKIAFCENDGGGAGTVNPNTDEPNDGTNPNNPVPLYSNRPQPYTVRCPDGIPFTYTVPAGLFIARTQELADAAARNYARTLANQLKICLSRPLNRCCINTLYSSTIVASGGRGQFRWVIVSGLLPTGIIGTPIGRNGLRLSGTPTINGNYSFTVRAVDAFGDYSQESFTITVWGITTASLPDGVLSANYDQQLASSHGTAPYTYTLVSGGFPLGVDLTTSGLITGVVGEEGVFDSVIKVTDALGRSCEKSFTLTVPAVARWSHWPMDALVGGELEDCIAGLDVPLAVQTFPPGGRVVYAFEPGLLGNAVHFSDLVGGDIQVSAGTTLAGLKHDGAGFSLCAWIFINSLGDPNPSSTGYASIRYTGGGSEVRLLFKNGDASFVAKDGGINNETIPIVLPSLGEWHFLHMFQSETEMGIQWDNGAVTLASFVPNASPSVNGQMIAYQSSGGWIPNDWVIDAISLRLDARFSIAQLAYLYNGGIGRTCPMTLP